MNQSHTVYQVSELTNEMRRLMETSYPEIWIEGELSSLSAPASGHVYFSLKDERSQLRCAMFKGRASISRYKPKAGDLVRVRAKISVYGARGDLQCVVQHIEEAGEGLLQRRFEELKQELNRQGLFEQKYKKTIPAFPNHIGVITSPSGAAVQDVLTTLKRRCPGIPVTVYPAVVQGDSAAQSIIQGLRDAVQHKQADVLILTRGGGSLEDLWCFNHDELAKIIFDCPIPVVSGVGHEVDITIADLVADARAATPTAAAEMVTPDTRYLAGQLISVSFRLHNAQRRAIERLGQNVDMTAKQLVHPKESLIRKNERLRALSNRVKRAITNDIKWQSSAIDRTGRQLLSSHPLRLVKHKTNTLIQTSNRLKRAHQRGFEINHAKISALSGQLNMISPLATLERGFSIARDKNQDIIRSKTKVMLGDPITLQLADGAVDCKVLSTKNSPAINNIKTTESNTDVIE